MKPKINKSKEKINSNKNKNCHRYSSINLCPNSKITNIVVNQELSSIYKTNKTIQKYINEKLNLLSKDNTQKNNISKGFPKTIENNIRTKKNLSFSLVTKNKSTKNNKNRKIKGRNYKYDHDLYSNEFNTNEINFRYNDFPKLLKNNKIKRKEILKKEINTKINNLIKNKDSTPTTKGKLIKEFYQNYLSSMSMSTGISLNHNNEIIYKGNNPNLLKENKEINSSNNNYEIDSTEEEYSHEIIFKGINEGSPITFGNSFSHTNSKRSSNSNNKEKFDAKEKMDKSVLLLKNQNEILKKELKHSNQQITFLKNEIEKLVKIRKMNIENYKYNININEKKHEFKPKIIVKNSSYLDMINNVVDKEHLSNNKINKNLSYNSCNSNKNKFKNNRKSNNMHKK